MGFGLWPALNCRKAHGVNLVRELEGKKIAVDVSIWIAEASLVRAKCPWLSPQGAAVRLCFHRVVLWLRFGLTPVIVLEGNAGSRGVRAGRRRMALGSSFSDALCDIESLCKVLGVPCIRAPGEGEAYCARLAELGLIDAIATNDCDVFAWGAQCPVLKNLRIEHPISNSSAEIVPDTAARLFLTREAIILIAALIGNEYDGTGGSGVARVGLQTAVQGTQWFQAYHEKHRAKNGSLIAAFCEELSAVSNGRRDGLFRRLKPLCNLASCTGCARCGHGNVRKATHGKKGCSECGTASRCTQRIAADGSDRILLCQCAYCSAVRELSEGSEGTHAKARACATVLERAASDRDFKQRLTETVNNYELPAPARGGPNHGSIAWTGPANCDAVVRVLAGNVETASIHESMVQMRLEWCLSVAAQEAPLALQNSKQSPTSLGAWAERRGLEFVPQRRRRPFSDAHLTVLLDWRSLNGASASDAALLQDLPTHKRHGRTSLVKRLGRLVRIPDKESKLEAKRLRDAVVNDPRQMLLKDYFGKATQTSKSSASASSKTLEVPVPSPSTPSRVQLEPAPSTSTPIKLRRRSVSPGSSRKRLRSRQLAGNENDNVGTAAQPSKPAQALVSSPSTPTRARCRKTSPCSSRKRPRWRLLTGSPSVDSSGL